MAFNIREIFKVLADADVDYVDAMLAAAVVKDLDGVPIPVASIAHLIQMKQVADRPQDREDILALQDIAATGGQEAG